METGKAAGGVGKMNIKTAIRILESDSCYECTYGGDNAIDCTNSLCSYKAATKEAIRALKQQEEIEEQGRLIELPCKVGDTVYYFHNLHPLRHEVEDYTSVQESEVEQVTVYEDGFGVGFRDNCFDFTRRKLGETAFLTKAEAEAKLAELKGE